MTLNRKIALFHCFGYIFFAKPDFVFVENALAL